MKVRSFLTLALSVAALSFLVIGSAAAQDPVKIAPGNYKVLSENERVRVLEASVQPGGKIGKHSHPDHVLYVVEGGKMKFSKPDGTSSEADLATGHVALTPAETHSAENIGTNAVRAIVIELKEKPRAAPKPAAKKM